MSLIEKLPNEVLLDIFDLLTIKVRFLRGNVIWSGAAWYVFYVCWMDINNTVFPQIRPAGIIFLQGLQLRVLLECGY